MNEILIFIFSNASVYNFYYIFFCQTFSMKCNYHVNQTWNFSTKIEKVGQMASNLKAGTLDADRMETICELSPLDETFSVIAEKSDGLQVGLKSLQSKANLKLYEHQNSWQKFNRKT